MEWKTMINTLKNFLKKFWYVIAVILSTAIGIILMGRKPEKINTKPEKDKIKKEQEKIKDIKKDIEEKDKESKSIENEIKNDLNNTEEKIKEINNEEDPNNIIDDFTNAFNK